MATRGAYPPERSETTTLRMPMAAEPEAGTRWLLILLRVTTVFGLVIGGGYWLRGGDRTTISVEAAQPLIPPANPFHPLLLLIPLRHCSSPSACRRLAARGCRETTC